MRYRRVIITFLFGIGTYAVADSERDLEVEMFPRIADLPIVEGEKTEVGIGQFLVGSSILTPRSIFAGVNNPQEVFSDYWPDYGYPWHMVKYSNMCSGLGAFPERAAHNVGRVYLFVPKGNTNEKFIGMELKPHLVTDAGMDKTQVSSTANSEFTLKQLCELFDDDTLISELNRAIPFISAADNTSFMTRGTWTATLETEEMIFSDNLKRYKPLWVGRGVTHQRKAGPLDSLGSFFGRRNISHWILPDNQAIKWEPVKPWKFDWMLGETQDKLVEFNQVVYQIDVRDSERYFLTWAPAEDSAQGRLPGNFIIQNGVITVQAFAKDRGFFRVWVEMDMNKVTQMQEQSAWLVTGHTLPLRRGDAVISPEIRINPDN